METPLDVLSRAASLVHADDEKLQAGACDITVEEKGLTAFPSCRGARSPCPRAGL
ncbi:unnamed protein product, partial [Bubo scandiacus]